MSFTQKSTVGEALAQTLGRESRKGKQSERIASGEVVQVGSGKNSGMMIVRYTLIEV